MQNKMKVAAIIGAACVLNVVRYGSAAAVILAQLARDDRAIDISYIFAFLTGPQYATVDSIKRTSSYAQAVKLADFRMLIDTE